VHELWLQLKKANLTKVRDAKPRVLASLTTFRRAGLKIAGLPIIKQQGENDVYSQGNILSISFGPESLERCGQRGWG
jgi:hypothetical protein